MAPVGSASGQPQIVDGRYELQGQMVYDKRSNLSWTRCSVGQTWTPQGRCAGKPVGFGFASAARTFVGVWRVPTKAEIDTLFSQAASGPKINATVFPDMVPGELLYWTLDQISDSNAWYADFGAGKTYDTLGDYAYLHQKMFVRLVHVGQMDTRPVVSITRFKAAK